MHFDWSLFLSALKGLAAWAFEHPGEVAATITMVAGWFGWRDKLKADAAATRAKIRAAHLDRAGELAYGRAAWEDRRSDGARVNKVARALDEFDKLLLLLSGEASTPAERAVAQAQWTALHERETAQAPQPPPPPGC